MNTFLSVKEFSRTNFQKVNPGLGKKKKREGTEKEGKGEKKKEKRKLRASSS